MKRLFLIFFVLLCSDDICSQRECVTAGRFPYPGTNCTKYMVCAAVNDDLIKTDWMCPRQTTFNPKTQKCVTNYICTEYICDPSINPSATASNFYDPNGSGNTYVRCVPDLYDPKLLIPVVLRCPAGQIFIRQNPYDLLSPGACVQTVCSDAVCSQRECVTAGRFPYPGTNCTKYMMCAAVNNDLIKTDWTCPRQTRFNQKTQKCVTNYICTEYICDPSINPSAPASNFYDPNGSGNTYVTCVPDLYNPNLLIPVARRCPAGQNFIRQNPYDLLSPGACVQVNA